MFVVPVLSVFAPVVDLADPPPVNSTRAPNGASRLALSAGMGLTDDIGWELDLTAVASGYLVQREESVSTASTIWTQLQATHYLPAESEMVADRFWIGPFVRGTLGTEMMGRHGIAPGALQRIDASVGLRGEADLGATAALGIGWSVVHDSPRKQWTQGMHVLVDVQWR